MFKRFLLRSLTGGNSNGENFVKYSTKKCKKEDPIRPAPSKTVVCGKGEAGKEEAPKKGSKKPKKTSKE